MFVYLLRNAADKCYVGATVNIERRLRQHNREIVGGAKRTCVCGPWTRVLHVSGFESWNETLQFEWALQHVQRSRFTKTAYMESIHGRTRFGKMGTATRKKAELFLLLGAWPKKLTLHE